MVADCDIEHQAEKHTFTDILQLVIAVSEAAGVPVDIGDASEWNKMVNEADNLYICTRIMNWLKGMIMNCIHSI